MRAWAATVDGSPGSLRGTVPAPAGDACRADPSHHATPRGQIKRSGEYGPLFWRQSGFVLVVLVLVLVVVLDVSGSSHVPVEGEHENEDDDD